MGIELRYTAVGSGYYKVEKNGAIEPPNHTTEREAQEHAGNLELANPDDVISYFHDYEVVVEAVFVPDPDTTGPTASITVSDADLVAGETAIVTFTFSEPVVNFDATDVLVENGTLGPILSGDGGITWVAEFTPAPDILDSTNVISLTGAYEDAAGNSGSPATSPNIVIDTTVVTPPPSNPLTDLLPGQWYKFPNSLMNAVDPCPGKNCPYSGTQGQKGVMDAWSSGMYDILRKRLLVWGGGHSNYGGNEVYAFGPIDNNPVWDRLTEPSVPTLDAELNGDGTPASRHNYGTIQHDPVGDRMFALSGGSLFSNVTKGSRRCHSFDLETKTWKTDWPYLAVGDVHNTASEYDPISKGFWVKNSFSNQVHFFDPEANGGLGSWTPKGGSWYSSPYMTLAIDTNRHLMFGIGGNVTNNKRLNRFDLNNNALRTNPVTSGDAGGIALETAQAPGFVYDPLGDRFIGWQGGTSVYQLNPQTYEWLKLANHTDNAVDPGPHCPQGTYGRMRLVPEYNGIIVVSKNTDSVYFYKLTNETLPAVAPVPAALVNGTTQTLQAAIDAAAAGATITVGEGPISGATVTKPLTIVGAGKGKTVIKGVVSDKGILVIKADATISGFSFQDAKGLQGNEAGIRHDAGKLAVTDCDFARCYNGYLGNADVSFLRDDFIDCGKGDGYTHSIYAGDGAKLVEVDSCTMSGTKIGHHLKSRSEKTVIKNTTMNPATESYSCDFPWGGVVEIDGLVAAQNVGTDNKVIINYGSEVNAAPYTQHSMTILNSSLSSVDVVGAIGIRVDAKTPITEYLTNVIFNGVDILVTGDGLTEAVYQGCTSNGVAIPDTV